MDYKVVSTYLDSIPSFTGEPAGLHPFLNAIDVMQPAIQRLSGKPKQVINAISNSSWEVVKSTLVTHFDEPETETRLME
ncbi:unnamed protein product [Hermetia illucens]|uniref:Uncharacterized protein n=1 Tax=Hermetia illucens TaxID=343691 RepID=A0A7R8UDL7_HERIL|nr:unnamed protein product [Hermetia illucens]